MTQVLRACSLALVNIFFMKYKSLCFSCLRHTVQENMHFIIPLLSIKTSMPKKY